MSFLCALPSKPTRVCVEDFVFLVVHRAITTTILWMVWKHVGRRCSRRPAKLRNRQFAWKSVNLQEGVKGELLPRCQTAVVGVRHYQKTIALPVLLFVGLRLEPEWKMALSGWWNACTKVVWNDTKLCDERILCGVCLSFRFGREILHVHAFMMRMCF